MLDLSSELQGDELKKWVKGVVDSEGDKAPPILSALAINYLDRDNPRAEVIRVMVENTPNFPLENFLKRALFTRTPEIIASLRYCFDTPLEDKDFVWSCFLTFIGVTRRPPQADKTLDLLITLLHVRGISLYNIFIALGAGSRLLEIDPRSLEVPSV